ncbi:hypothetical protein Bbelb_444380, partial [Branchiostoma belcheri]
MEGKNPRRQRSSCGTAALKREKRQTRSAYGAWKAYSISDLTDRKARLQPRSFRRTGAPGANHRAPAGGRPISAEPRRGNPSGDQSQRINSAAGVYFFEVKMMDDDRDMICKGNGGSPKCPSSQRSSYVLRSMPNILGETEVMLACTCSRFVLDLSKLRACTPSDSTTRTKTAGVTFTHLSRRACQRSRVDVRLRADFSHAVSHAKYSQVQRKNGLQHRAFDQLT